MAYKIYTRDELAQVGLTWAVVSGKAGCYYIIRQDGVEISRVRYMDIRCGSIDEYISREIEWKHIKVKGVNV